MCNRHLADQDTLNTEESVLVSGVEKHLGRLENIPDLDILGKGKSDFNMYRKWTGNAILFASVQEDLLIYYATKTVVVFYVPSNSMLSVNGWTVTGVP